MRIARTVTFGCLLVVWLLAITGCSKKETRADENKPIDEVKAEALKMNATELKEVALKYKEALTAKQAELDKIAAKLDNLHILNYPQHASHLSFICLSRRRGPVLIRRAATIGNSAVYDKVQAISSWKTTTGEPLLKVCSRSFQGGVV